MANEGEDMEERCVRATAGGGAGLAGDPKLIIFTEQLLQIAYLAGDPKRKG